MEIHMKFVPHWKYPLLRPTTVNEGEREIVMNGDKKVALNLPFSLVVIGINNAAGF